MSFPSGFLACQCQQFGRTSWPLHLSGQTSESKKPGPHRFALCCPKMKVGSHDAKPHPRRIKNREFSGQTAGGVPCFGSSRSFILSLCAQLSTLSKLLLRFAAATPARFVVIAGREPTFRKAFSLEPHLYMQYVSFPIKAGTPQKGAKKFPVVNIHHAMVTYSR